MRIQRTVTFTNVLSTHPYGVLTRTLPGRPFAYTPPSRVHHAHIEYFYVSDVYRLKQYMKSYDHIDIVGYLILDSDITVVRCFVHICLVFFFHIFSMLTILL